MSKITVYCGAREHVDSRFKKDAYLIGERIAAHKMTLIYGGGSQGLMGATANGVLENGGKVIGIIPQRLKKLEAEHKGVSELLITNSMSERKVMMEERADAFLALAGGIGTLDELFQVIAERQLGYHQKPIGILNSLGYFDTLLNAIEEFSDNGFVPKSSLTELIIDDSPKRLISRIKEELNHE